MGKLKDLLRLSGLYYAPVERKGDDEQAGAAQQQNPQSDENRDGNKREKYRNYSPVPTKEDYNAHKDPRDPDSPEKSKPLLGAGAKKKVTLNELDKQPVEDKAVPAKPYAMDLNAITAAQMSKTFDTNPKDFEKQQYERVKIAYQKGASDDEIRHALRWDIPFGDQLISRYKTETAQNVAKDAIEEAQVDSLRFGRP